MRLFLVRLDGYGSGAKHPRTHNHQLLVMSYLALLLHTMYILHIMVANIFLLRKKREITLNIMEKSQDLYVILFRMYIHLLQAEICLATLRLHHRP